MDNRKLHDYSDDFIPDLRLEHFSESTLSGIARLYAKLFLGLDGFWFKHVRDQFGDKGALSCDIKAWEEFVRYESVMIRRYLKIKGNDLTALMKTIQLTPWFQLTRSNIELKNEKSAILTINYCPTIAALENKGEENAYELCQLVCPKIYKGIASVFGPNISVRSLKTPPRESRHDFYCQREYISTDKK